MKLLAIDHDGNLLALALHALQCGHEVRWFSVTPGVGENVPGLMPIDNWASHISWADLTVSSVHMDKLAFYSQRGYSIVYPQPLDGVVDVFPNHVKRTEHVSVKAALAFATSTPAKYTIETAVSLYHSYDAADAIMYLRNLKWPDVVLTSVEPSGLRATISQFVHFGVPVGPCLLSFPLSGGVVGAQSKTGAPTIELMSALLEHRNVYGWVNVDVIFDGSGGQHVVSVYTSSTPTLALGIVKSDMAEWYRYGGDPQTTPETGICLFFRQSEKAKCGPLYGITRGTGPHVRMRAAAMARGVYQTSKGGIKEADLWVGCGEEPLRVLGFGTSISQAARRAHSTLDKLYMAGHSYDKHAGQELRHEMPRLHLRDIAKEIIYG